MQSFIHAAVVTTLAMGFAACSSDPDPTPMFPANYASTYQEVRDCRPSADHDTMKVRMLAGPTAYDPYLARTDPFPVDAIVIKEEYAFEDTTCSGEIVGWTAMQRTTGIGEDAWTFQRVDANRKVTDNVGERCINCHTVCGVPPEGFDGTCAAP